MSRFEELRNLALQRSHAFVHYSEECHTFAILLVSLLKTYLGCPDGVLHFYEVDREHNLREETRGPNLCFCFDSYWYFSLGIDFPYAEPVAAALGPAYHIRVEIGIKKIGSEFSIRLPEKDFRVAAPADANHFCEHVFESLKGLLERPWTEPRKTTIGFTTSD